MQASLHSAKKKKKRKKKKRRKKKGNKYNPKESKENEQHTIWPLCSLSSLLSWTRKKKYCYCNSHSLFQPWREGGKGVKR